MSVSCPCVLALLSVCLCSVRLPGRLLRGCVLTQGDASPGVGALARSVLQPMVALLRPCWVVTVEEGHAGGSAAGCDKDSGRLGGGRSLKGSGDPLSKVEELSVDEGCRGWWREAGG